jgi:Pentapeptide repeats (8 copies)
MPESLQQRVEKIRLWAKDPDRTASRILVAIPTVLLLVAIALWIVWIVPKHQVRNSFGSYLNADITKQTELENARRATADKAKQSEIDTQLNANATQIRADNEKALELENEFRKTVTQIVLSIFGLFILYLTWKRARAGDRTVEVAEQGHITDRYTKAIEQLGKLDGDKPNIEVRLGAIYALERIAHDSPRDHWTIMEVLTAYVRQNAPAAPTSGTPTTAPLRYPRTDIQAILTVLGRRPTGPRRERPDQQLDLSSTHLENIQLQSANLNGTNFTNANLQNANLWKAKLQNVSFMFATLDYANLWEVDLQGAILNAARFRQASFASAILRDAHVGNADLRNAQSLHPDQIKAARLWENAHYSPDLRADLDLPPEE